MQSDKKIIITIILIIIIMIIMMIVIIIVITIMIITKCIYIAQIQKYCSKRLTHKILK